MTWDVAIRKTLGHGPQRFELDLTLHSAARRLVLFGPSGAGKSVSLQAIAGLLRPDAGHVRVAGELLFDGRRGIDLPAGRRGLAYLFQDYALFPHLTVRQNIAFGLARGWTNPGRRHHDPAVQRWLRSFELEPLADRFPDQLSGGQRQRTALARALVAQPRALLLDEPFAALDAPLRRRLRAELLSLQQTIDVPMLLITHDDTDVDVFAEEVIHLERGRVVLERAAAGAGA